MNKSLSGIEIFFIGVGDAFSPALGNSSIFIKARDNILIDCGYSNVEAILNHMDDIDSLDLIYLTHRHFDHCFGLPSLLLIFHKNNRKKPLKIICNKEVLSTLRKLFDITDPRIPGAFSFSIEFFEVEASDTFRGGNYDLLFAETAHSALNYSVRINTEGRSIFYSGDGDLTEPVAKIMEGVDLAVQEAYTLNDNTRGHASLFDIYENAPLESIDKLALIHISTSSRLLFNSNEVLINNIQKHTNLLIPSKNDILEL